MPSIRPLSAAEVQARADEIEREWPKTKRGNPMKLGQFPLGVQRELMRRAAVRVASDCNKLGLGFSVTVEN